MTNPTPLPTRAEVEAMLERNWTPDAWENMTSTDDELMSEAIDYVERLAAAYLEALEVLTYYAQTLEWLPVGRGPAILRDGGSRARQFLNRARGTDSHPATASDTTADV